MWPGRRGSCYHAARWLGKVQIGETTLCQLDLLSDCPATFKRLAIEAARAWQEKRIGESLGCDSPFLKVAVAEIEGKGRNPLLAAERSYLRSALVGGAVATTAAVQRLQSS